MLDRLTGLIDNVGQSANVLSQFPLWFKALCIFSALYGLAFGGLFIYYYARHDALLKTSAALTALEKKALSGDAASMIELSLFGSARALDILASVLQTNPDFEVRQKAVFAIANIKGSSKVETLGKTLLTENRGVAAACAEALGRSGDPSAIPYLLRALELRIDGVVGEKAAEALGKFAPSEATVRALVAAINDGDDKPFQAEAARQSLVKFGRISLSFLLDNLATSASARGLDETIQAVRVLGAADTRSAIASLRNAKSRIDKLVTIRPEIRQRLLSDCDNVIMDLQGEGKPSAN